MSLQSRLSLLINAIGADVKNLQTQINGLGAPAWNTITSKPLNITSFEGLAGAANKLPYFTGSGALTLADFTSLARVLASRSSYSAMRTDLDVYSKAEAAALLAGSEMGYAEVTSMTTRTNTAPYSVAAGAKLPGISVTVVGEGKAVAIKFEGSVQHTVANAVGGFYLICNNSASVNPGGYIGGIQLGSTTTTRLFQMERRFVLSNGVSYTFEVGTYFPAGTATIIGTTEIPHWLSVRRL